MKRLAIFILMFSVTAICQITGETNTVTACKNEGDPDCITVIGYTMLRTAVDPVKITDNFRQIASIDKDGKVTIGEGVTAEYVIRMMAQQWMEQSRLEAQRHEEDIHQCLTGWKHSLDRLAPEKLRKGRAGEK